MGGGVGSARNGRKGRGQGKQKLMSFMFICLQYAPGVVASLFFSSSSFLLLSLFCIRERVVIVQAFTF